MTEPEEVRGRNALTPAVVAAAAFAVLATLMSITFVAARGGLILPVAGSPPPVAVASPTPVVTVGPTPAPSEVAVGPTPSIAPAPSPSSEPSTAPTAVPSGPPPTPHPTSFDPLFALAGCPSQPGCYEYTVRHGDTLSTISDHYRVALWITMALNPEAVSSGIVAGETVYLGHDPEARLKPCPKGESCRLYTVRQGDTISRIARRYGLTSSAILARNPGLQPTLIVPGQVIKLPLYVKPA